MSSPPLPPPSICNRTWKDAWEAVAEKIYEKKGVDHLENIVNVRSVFEKEGELLSPLVERCPGFVTILSFILENKFGYRVRHVEMTVKMTD